MPVWLRGILRGLGLAAGTRQAERALSYRLCSTRCSLPTAAGAAGSPRWGSGLAPHLAPLAVPDTERWAANKSLPRCWKDFTISLHSSVPFEYADQRLQECQPFISERICAQGTVASQGRVWSVFLSYWPSTELQYKAEPSALADTRGKPAWFYSTKRAW